MVNRVNFESHFALSDGLSHGVSLLSAYRQPEKPVKFLSGLDRGLCSEALYISEAAPLLPLLFFSIQVHGHYACQ